MTATKADFGFTPGPMALGRNKVPNWLGQGPQDLSNWEVPFQYRLMAM